ncbi:MAG: acylphosphatase, partial [Actinomycetes bacterium]
MTEAPDRVATRSGLVRLRVRVTGIVQGVGFRPFVHGLAVERGLAGLVGNDTRGVRIEVEGPPEQVSGFLADLRRKAPALAVVESVDADPVPAQGDRGFVIVASTAAGGRTALVPPDSATCEDCLREMDDPRDRRFGYPFVNCTACGPRFTIVTGVPYDRPLTTMSGFTMCADCAREYDDPGDRRYHAQPVCCPTCGPALRLLTSTGERVPGGEPLGAAADLLRSGAVLAVKGIGGHHLAAVAGDETAVSALRARKHREDRPFAVMAADLAQASDLGRVDDAAAAALTDRRRPIVLLPRRDGAPVARSVAPGNRHLGVMLPYT